MTDNTECNLKCQNGGVCQFEAFESPTQTADVGGPSCSCLSGFAGDLCEHAFEECGNFDHICLHGTKCVAPIDPDSDWTCSCEGTEGFCQQHRRTICPSSTSSSRVYRGPSSVAYCVNDGECTEYEDNGIRYPGCICPEAYTGPHCEFLKAATPGLIPRTKKNNDKARVAIVIFLVCVVTPALILFLYRRVRGQSNRSKTNAIAAAHIEAAEEDNQGGMPRDDEVEEVDFDLEDIELY